MTTDPSWAEPRGPGGSPLAVLVIAEQLRRRVPGGIGTYVRGLLAGTRDLAARAPSPVGLTLLASRPRRGAPDPLGSSGWPVQVARLPGPLLTRCWDWGLLGAPGGFAVEHAVSLAWPRPGRRPEGGPEAPGRRPARTPLAVVVHDLAWRHHPEATTRRGRRWHEARLARSLDGAAAFLVPSHEVAEDLVAAGADRERVTVVPWGVDHLAPPDTRGAAELLGATGVRGEYLLTVGTREPRKNLARLVAAYRAARPELPAPWPLVVVGPRGWGTEEASGSESPPEGVVLLGPVEPGVLSGLYAGARLLAYTPLEEGYGFPPLEAMFFGVPAVVSTTVPSVVAGGGEAPGALRVDPLDTGAIAEALGTLAADPALRSSLGQAGSRLARERTWLAVAQAHVRVWEGIA